MSATQSAFKLSDPGASLGHDPAMREYLRCYDFPQAPEIRYGYIHFESPQSADRVRLFGQAWLPQHAIGTVLLVHGYAEHTGNYAKLVKNLTDARFAVAAMDLRGHGLSEGPRGHLESAHAYAEDIEHFLDNVFSSLLPHRPLFIWAHSLGSMVSLQLLLRARMPARPIAATFISPLLGFPTLSGTQKALSLIAPLIAKLLPTLPVAHGIPSDILSHDKTYLSARKEDPLINNVTTPRWFLSVKKAVEELQSRSAEYQKMSPTLLLLAGQEKVTNLTEARKFAFQAYAGLRHKVIEFPGYFHELEKEPEIRERIVSESIAWFRSHIQE
jgi:acylglycerol lipase